MQDLGIWKPYSTTLNEASVRDSTEISFLVNGCDVSSVTASRYFAVLPFAYFPSLHAVALEFPLDVRAVLLPSKVYSSIIIIALPHSQSFIFSSTIIIIN